MDNSDATKALLLRVGIDTSCGGLAPIFEDGSFEYIPIPEGVESEEERTYGSVLGRSGKPFSHYLHPNLADWPIHYDPEFETCTYGDPTIKYSRLLKLNPEDILVFYVGLDPYRNSIYERGLYIIGYFTVSKILHFNNSNYMNFAEYCKLCSNNAHIKRNEELDGLVIVMGDRDRSRLLEKAIKISQLKLDRIGRRYHVASDQMRQLLGISGSLQRAATPRLIEGSSHMYNLKNLINYDYGNL